MKESIHLILSKRGLVRTRKHRPDLLRGEVAIKLNISISDHWFRSAIPVASLEIPDTAVIGDGLEIKLDLLEDGQLKDIDSAVKIEIERRDSVSPGVKP